jgi:tetratricopeptide (TPR) repeat protein
MADSTIRFRLGPFAALMLALLIGTAAYGQGADSTGKRPTANESRDSLYSRARQLVSQGNGAAGRALIDSAVTASVGTADYPNALYWRAALAAAAADAERDYRRVIVEYPFSAHSGDALLALAQLEMARGDRDPAIDHLQRFLLQHPNDPQSIRAGIWLGRLLLEQNQLGKGCAVLLRTRAALGDTAIEIRNQVDYYATRCNGVDTTPPVSRPAPPRIPPADNARPARTSDSLRHETTRRDTSSPTARPSSPPAGRYTVQVAAYDTKDSAQKFITTLSGRGVVARLVGTRAPFRVRVGHYATDAEATASARALKEKGIVGFVTTTDNESAPAPTRP